MGNIEIKHDICPFCRWEDDFVQNNDKDFDVVTKDGKIVTYYRTSLRYFKNEFAKKGGKDWLYKGEEIDE